MRRFLLAACFCVSWAVTCYAQTAIRPDQICNPTCATPDVTWLPGGTGYQIGTTVPWRGDNTVNPTFIAADNAKVVELTYPTGPITATVPDATLAAFTDGFAFTIQTGAQPVTLNRTGSTQTINGLSSVKLGPYQSVRLLSRGSSNRWYALMSVPQPSAQTGATKLADTMTWQ